MSPLIPDPSAPSPALATPRDLTPEELDDLHEANHLYARLASRMYPDVTIGYDQISTARTSVLDWVDIVVSTASELYLGFDILGGSSSDSDALQDLNDKVTQIQASLNNLNTKIDTVLSVLQSLPSVISGIIDAAFCKQWLTSCTADVGSISDKTKDLATFQANRLAVDLLVTDLEKSIQQVWAFGGNGAMAAAVTSSAVATWAQAKSMLLRDVTTNPSGLKIQDMSFYAFAKTNYTTFAATFPAHKQAASDIFQATPHSQILQTGNVPQIAYWTYDTTKGRFAPMLLGPAPPVPVPNQQHYDGFLKFNPPNPPDSTTLPPKILAAQAPHPLPSPPFPPGSVSSMSIDMFIDPVSQFVDPTNVGAARGAWGNLQTAVYQAMATTQFLWKSDDAAKMISQAFAP
jgi:hypothetical protein